MSESQYNKYLCTDPSLNISRYGDEKVAKRSRRKSKFSCKYACRDKEHRDCDVGKSLKCLLKKLSGVLCKMHNIRME